MPAQKRFQFIVPPKGVFSPNGQEDSLNYYYHSGVGWLYRYRTQMTLSLLDKQYQSALELGYGSGILFPSLIQIAKNLCGIDYESDAEKISRDLQKLGIDARLTKADILRMPYPDQKFDLVVSISTS